MKKLYCWSKKDLTVQSTTFGAQNLLQEYEAQQRAETVFLRQANPVPISTRYSRQLGGTQDIQTKEQSCKAAG